MTGDLNVIGRMLIATGLALVALGVLLVFFRQIPWLGHLPGDIVIRRESFTFYFPLGTCLVLSVIGSLILWLMTRR